MNFTPKKSSTSAPDQLLQTPKAVSSDRLSTGSNDDCNVLLETFSGMKINNASGALKRSADLMTVEGSPINVMKRMDSNPTPNAKSLVTAYSISSFAGVGELLNQTCDNNLKGDTTRTVVLADAQPKHPRKVYVISSGSDSHDTGNHQENALRTSLLCGADGCLRRHQLGLCKSSFHFIHIARIVFFCCRERKIVTSELPLISDAEEFWFCISLIRCFYCILDFILFCADDSLEWALEGDIKPASISDLIRYE